jgi:ABC-type thiamine transport system substrate-binding protein
MDDYYNLKRLALILAIQTEVDGAKLDNFISQSQGFTTFNYDSYWFQTKAQELTNLAYKHNEQL